MNTPDNRVTISFTAPGTFDVVDTTTGAALATGVAYLSGTPIRFNGWSTSITGAPATGDEFAVDHGLTSPLAGNTGSGVIDLAIVSASDPNVADAVTITFDNPPSTYTVTGATTGSPTANVSYSSGDPVSFNGWTVTISGTPGTGDTFSIRPNPAGVGDNRNALALAALQQQNHLDNRTATFGSAYGQMVTRVGATTQQAAFDREARSTVLEFAVAGQQSVSGVNLDEEAASILRFQQAYQANARAIAAADELFQTLLGAVGG